MSDVMEFRHLLLRNIKLGTYTFKFNDAYDLETYH